MDRRQRKTRKAIFNAFSELLTCKSVSQITVQEIIDRADVGRTTFYAHFPQKDDLLRELCADLFAHVFSQPAEAELTHDFSMAAEAPKAFVAHILYHLRDHGKKVILLLTCESGELFQDYFRQYFNEFAGQHIYNASRYKNSDIPKDFLMDHICASFINLVRWWQKNSMKLSPEKLSEYYTSVIQPMV